MMTDKTIRKRIATVNKSIKKLTKSRNKLIDKRDDYLNDLALMLRQKFEDMGFVSGAIVRHKKLGTEHRIDVTHLDTNCEFKKYPYVIYSTPPPGIPDDGRPRLVLPKPIEEFELVSSPKRISKRKK
jgi:hypothetical protein